MPREKILIVDDEQPILEAVGDTLSEEDFIVATASDWQQAEAAAMQTRFDLFILDFKMPDLDGIEMMKRLRSITPSAEAIIITGYGTIEKGVEAIRSGARDFITKPLESYELLHRVNTILERRRLHLTLRQKEFELKDKYCFEQIVGVSQALAGVRELGARASAVMSSVLIEGESGTGKELLARAIHYSGKRAEGPFVAVNCGAISPSIAERELFGNERGAFTGADDTKLGYFEAANGGTLFLDEIGELPLDLQVKLLRTIDNQEILRVGGTKPVRLDVRLLFATNRDLWSMVEEKTFRHDLYYRINVIRITIPPLRERREDIPVLTTAFLERVCKRAGVEPKTIAEDAMAALEDHDWPGNGRELENVIERAVALSTRSQVELEDIPGWILREGAQAKSPELVCDFMSARRQAQERFDRDFLLKVLRQHGGNVSHTAKAIGLARSALQRFLRKYRINRELIEAEAMSRQ